MKSKKIFLIIPVLIVAMISIFFLSQSSTSKNDTFLTAEGKWIAEKNSSAQQIIDYYSIEKIILNTDFEKKSSIVNSAEQLMSYAKQYHLEDAQKKIETIQNNVDVVKSFDITQKSFYLLISDFANCLVGGTYAKEYECPYTLQIDVANYIDNMTSWGYTFEERNTVNETYYQFKKNDKNEGSICMDPKGNVTLVLASIDVSPYTTGFSTESYASYSEDEKITADTANAVDYINSMTVNNLLSDFRLSYLCTAKEIIQIYEFLKTLSNEELAKLFSKTSSLYYLQTENHVVTIFFMNGKIQISSILNLKFYNNPVFPDIYTSSPTDVTAKEIKSPTYNSLENYIESNNWDYAMFYICTSSNETTTEPTQTTIEDKNDGQNIVTYEFDTYDNKHIIIDTSCVDQQVSLNQPGDYGDVELEQIAPGKDIIYLSDGERYYIEDYSRNLLTITIPMN